MPNPQLQDILDKAKKLKQQHEESNGVAAGSLTKKHLFNVKLDQTETKATKEEIVALRKVNEDQLYALESLIEAFQAFKVDIPETKIPPYPSHPKEIRVSNLSDITTKQELLSLQKSIDTMCEIMDKEESDDQLITRISNKGKDTYIGEATPGTQEDDKNWRIRKVSSTSTTDYIEYANKSTEFNFSWKDRESYNYG